MKSATQNNALKILAALRTNGVGSATISTPNRSSSPAKERRQKAMAEVLKYWLASDGSKKDTSTSMQGNAENAQWRGAVAKALIEKGINNREVLHAFLTKGTPKKA